MTCRKEYAIDRWYCAENGQIIDCARTQTNTNGLSLIHANFTTSATVSSSGVPSSRIVLLKGIEENELLFITNYSSQKGKEMLENPHVALNFFWPELERQIRIVGKVVKTGAAESDAYFNSRPIGSQLGAWASQKIRVIYNR